MPERYLLAVVFLCSVFFTEVNFQTSNYGSRFFLTKAVVDYHTFKIDFQFPRLGTDWSLYRGHYFSDKPPGSSLMMIPQYVLLGKPVEFFLDNVESEEIWRERIVAWVVQISSVSLYTAMAFVGLYRLFSYLGLERRRFSLTLLSFFGTLMFPYSTAGTGEMFTMPLVVWGLVFLFKEPRSKKDLLCSGLFFGLGCLTANQMVFLAFTASLLVLGQNRKQLRNTLYFAGPIILFLCLMLLYNRINFDSFLAFPVKYWRGRANVQNIWFTFPSFKKVLDLLVLPEKGIFFYSPFLILGIPGYRKLLRNQPVGVVVFLVSSFLIYLSFFFLISLAGDGGPGGGHGFGFRYIVPALPFLCIGAAAWMSEKRLNSAEITLVIVSICLCSAGAVFGYRKQLLDYDIPFLLSIPTRNFVTYFLWKRFGIDNWLLRFASTTIFFGCIGAILLKYRNSFSKKKQSGDPQSCES